MIGFWWSEHARHSTARSEGLDREDAVARLDALADVPPGEHDGDARQVALAGEAWRAGELPRPEARLRASCGVRSKAV